MKADLIADHRPCPSPDSPEEVELWSTIRTSSASILDWVSRSRAASAWLRLSNMAVTVRDILLTPHSRLAFPPHTSAAPPAAKAHAFPRAGSRDPDWLILFDCPCVAVGGL